MKRTALTHTKMKRLMRALDIPQYAAVGLLESLWNLTARETPRGDIGKLSNEDIAIQLDWRGEPDSLMQALMVSRWIDVEEDLRFVVHDWHDHADDAVDNALARSGQTYANGQIPHMRRLSEREKSKLLAQYGDSVRTTCPRNAHNVPTPCALPVPEPVPVPVPEPVPKKVQKPSAVAEFVLPDWIDTKIWNTYLEVRVAKRAPKTVGAWNTVIKRLDEYRARGHDPNAVLENSIVGNWTTVWEPKGEKHGSTQQNRKPAAIERQSIAHDSIRAAAARRYGVGVVGPDGGGSGGVPQPDTSSGNTGHVPDPVGAAGAEVRTGDFQGRTVEGHL